MTRKIYKEIDNRINWDSCEFLTPMVISELEFWHKNLDCLNKKNLFSSFKVQKYFHFPMPPAWLAGDLFSEIPKQTLLRKIGARQNKVKAQHGGN